MTKSFQEIGKETGTDKVTHHGYHRFYPIFLEHYRNLKITMLEIGVDEDKSIKLWKKYFPKARIYGMDIHRGYVFDRGQVFKGDQSNLEDCSTVVKEIGNKVELIIDDGSHEPEHQIFSFIYFFEKLLKDNGTYIIEDIETSYWKSGQTYDYPPVKRGLYHKKTPIEVFKFLVDRLNSEFIKDKAIFKKSIIPEHIQDNIELISFQYNSIIIKKRKSEDLIYNHRNYRSRKNLSSKWYNNLKILFYFIFKK